INRRRKAIAEMKAKAKREKPMTPAQQKKFMRTFVKNQSLAIYTTGWTWKDVRGLTDDQLQIETTFVSAGATIAAGDPIPAVTSVSAVSSILAATPIAACVSTTAGASGSANGTVKRFSTLRELMYWAGRADLMVLYGLVSDKYKTERATGIGLGLWMDLRILITSRKKRDASIIWDDQDQWQIRS
nr:hypothetical protein [Tanacetum cinerariifolium]